MTANGRVDEPRDTETGLILVESPADVPAFETEEEENAYWDTHTTGEHFWDGASSFPGDERLPQVREKPGGRGSERRTAVFARLLATNPKRCRKQPAPAYGAGGDAERSLRNSDAGATAVTSR